MTNWTNDLSWTGAHNLPPRLQSDLLHLAALSTDCSRRHDPFSRELRDEAAVFFGIPSSWIATGAGSTSLIDAILRILSRHRTVIDLQPSYIQAQLTCERDFIEHRCIPIANAEDFRDAVRPYLDLGKALIYCVSPRNPFGYRFSNEDIRWALQNLHDSYLIVDEVYGDLEGNDALIHLLRTSDRLILVRSLSKAWGWAALRVGFLLWSGMPENFQEAYMMRHQLGAIQQTIAKQILRLAETFEEEFRAVVKRRRWFSNQIHSLGIPTWRSETSFVAAQVDATPTIHALGENGISVASLRSIPGYHCRWPDGIRISIGADNTLETVIQVLTTTLKKQ